MLKRIFALLLCLSLVFSAAGCGAMTLNEKSIQGQWSVMVDIKDVPFMNAPEMPFGIEINVDVPLPLLLEFDGNGTAYVKLDTDDLLAALKIVYAAALKHLKENGLDLLYDMLHLDPENLQSLYDFFGISPEEYLTQLLEKYDPDTLSQEYLKTCEVSDDGCIKISTMTYTLTDSTITFYNKKGAVDAVLHVDFAPLAKTLTVTQIDGNGYGFLSGKTLQKRTEA